MGEKIPYHTLSIPVHTEKISFSLSGFSFSLPGGCPSDSTLNNYYL
jgi:hypothetical protein